LAVHYRRQILGFLAHARSKHTGIEWNRVKFLTIFYFLLTQ